MLRAEMYACFSKFQLTTWKAYKSVYF